MEVIVTFHNIPKVVILDMDVKFTSPFWRTLFIWLGTQVQFNTAYHSQTDGKTERVKQVLEDMLRMYVMKQPTRWKNYLQLLEFYCSSYNRPPKFCLSFILEPPFQPS